MKKNNWFIRSEHRQMLSVRKTAHAPLGANAYNIDKRLSMLKATVDSRHSGLDPVSSTGQAPESTGLSINPGFLLSQE